MPSSTRPPLIRSTCATITATGPGSRKVAEVNLFPLARATRRDQFDERRPSPGNHDLIEGAILCTSELVTNACVHAKGGNVIVLG
ncbi:hypothetical protein [Streptomyces hirsutus]|uniref:hypothetical protein n=1 Tax=Streptomyces hirsutus TaxID=35620 RepID=UPI003687FC11